MIYDLDYPHIKIDKEKFILWISLDRNEARNAYSIPMIESLCHVLEEADYDPEVRVIVLGGQGKSFCSGGDIKAMENKEEMFSGESFELSENYRRFIQKVPRTIEAMRTPIIAMVQGAAIGAGLDLACMCDIRVASKEAKFGETFANLSLVPGDGGAYFLQRVIGYAKAMEMLLSCDIIDSQKALELGLINKLVEAKELKGTVEKLALKISTKAPVAISFGKLAMKMAYEQNLNQHLEQLVSMQGIAQRSKDHFEAIEAFNSKRSPDFKGL